MMYLLKVLLRSLACMTIVLIIIVLTVLGAFRLAEMGYPVAGGCLVIAVGFMMIVWFMLFGGEWDDD